MGYFEQMDRLHRQRSRLVKLECENPLCHRESDYIIRQTPRGSDREGMYCTACYYTAGRTESAA